jgi:hypothetical protein
MEIFVILIVLLFIFGFGLLFPTMLFLSDERKKKKVETLINYSIVSVFFILLVAVFSIFYESNAISLDTECNMFANFNCIFSKTLPKRIEPSIHIYFVFIIQCISMITYSYYTARKIMHYTNKERTLLLLVLYFMVSVVASIVHYYVLYGVVFTGGLSFFSLVVANQYGVLPFTYLIIMTYLNRDQLKFK